MPDTLLPRFEAGIRHANNGDFDLATDALLECALAEPTDFEFISAFLSNALKLAQANVEEPTVIRRSAAARSAIDELSSNVQTARTTRSWDGVFQSGLRLLTREPHHGPTLCALIEASLEKNELAIARRFFEMSKEAAVDEMETLQLESRLLARQRKFDEALACSQRKEALALDDAEPVKETARIIIERSRHRANFANETFSAASHQLSRQAKQPTAPQVLSVANITPQEKVRIERLIASSAIQRTPIQQLENTVREYPTDIPVYLQLASLYLEKGRDYDAEQLLAKARKETDNDARLRAAWEVVTMARLDKLVEVARQRVASEKTDEARHALDIAISRQGRVGIEIFTERCKAEPENAALRYELGLRLQQAGRVREACDNFEKALLDPQQKAAAAFQLGECQLHFQDIPTALRFFRLAADAALLPEQTLVMTKALQQAVVLTRDMKLITLAERYRTRLLRIAPEYKDEELAIETVNPLDELGCQLAGPPIHDTH